MLTINGEEKYWNGKKIPYGKDGLININIDRCIDDYENINFLNEARAVLKEYIAETNQVDDNNRYLEEQCADGKYLEELENTYSKMTTSDFYTKWTGYKPINELMDKRIKIVGYNSVLIKYDDLENYKRPSEFDKDTTDLIWKLITAYRNKYFEAEKQSRRIIKGFNGEFEVTVDLKNRLYSDYLKIISGVHFDKYEHDIIVISDKGVFTLEIKNHFGNLVWENGEFRESVNGVVKEEKITNPYEQCLNHKKSLCNVIDPKYVYSLILFANRKLTFSADDPEIANSLFYIDDFAEKFNELEPIMSPEEADQLFETIQSKRIYKDDAFQYVDMDKVDNLYQEWFSHINWKIKDDEQTNQEAKEAVEREKLIEDCAKKIINIKNIALNKREVLKKVKLDKDFVKEILFILFVAAYPFIWFGVVKILHNISQSIHGSFNFFSFLFMLFYGGIIIGGVLLFCVALGFAFHALGDLMVSIYYLIIDFFTAVTFNAKMSVAEDLAKENHEKAKELLNIYANEFPEVVELSDKIYKYRRRYSY